MLPALERRKDRQVAGLQDVPAGLEDVGQLALVHESCILPLADNQLCAELDLVSVPLEAVDERILRIIGPLDYVNEFAAKLPPDSHRLSPRIAGPVLSLWC